MTTPPTDTPKFDINLGHTSDKALLPSLEGGMFSDGSLSIRDIEGFQLAFERMFGGAGSGRDDSLTPIQTALKSLGVVESSYTYPTSKSDIAKALNAPPYAFSYGRITFAPDVAINGGILPWPGIAPDALCKICRENFAPQLVIGMRVDDIMRYSELSDQIWKPGWKIESRESDDQQTTKLKADIVEAQNFLLNCNIETTATDVRKRDADHYTSFKQFLAGITRDSLTYDGIAIYTDMDMQDRVKAFAALPAGNIRLCQRGGYQNNPDIFAVAVDEGGTVIATFTRDQLIWYVRNVRTDPQAFGYGWPECEIAIRIIKGFQNAMDINVDIFDKSSVANGMLTISGDAVTQRQLDLLNRMFINMKRGVTKWWALPVIGLPNGAKVELIDMTRIKGNEGYYKEFMNMLAGALCTLWRFPVRRLGYRISGGHRDAEPLPENSAPKMDEDDPGLGPLLGHLSLVINEYLLWTRWPHLKFRFTGAQPAEDAREYTLRSEAQTWGERRKEARLPPLEDLVKDPDLKELAKILSLTPSNPDMTNVFASLASSMFGQDSGEGDKGPDKGGIRGRKGDPANQASHGHTAGVPRDSKAEKQSAGSK